MLTLIAHDAIADDPGIPVLLVLGVVGLIAFWLDKRRTDREFMYLRAGKIPPSWENAYRKAHPHGPTDRDETPPV